MEGKLVIELYEYTDREGAVMPRFEYVPCDLSKCLKGRTASLKDIIERGFSDLPRRDQDTDKRRELLQKLEDANIGRIKVVYRAPQRDSDACVELTNIIPVTFTSADARMAKLDRDSIILKGRYRLSAGNEVTTLRDAQRLTLIYSNYDAESWQQDDPDEEKKEICLNITYLQE